MKTILCYGDSNTWGNIAGSCNPELMLAPPRMSTLQKCWFIRQIKQLQVISTSKGKNLKIYFKFSVHDKKLRHGEYSYLVIASAAIQAF